jgi:hypothetical protein
MSLKLSFPVRRSGLVSPLIPSLCLLLSACGGGDGTTNVASLPPPPATPTPTPTPSLPAGTMTYVYPSSGSIDVRKSWLNSPGTRAGAYDLIGRLTLTPGDGGATSYRVATPGDFSMTVADSTSGALSYTLNASAGIMPAGLTSSIVLSPEISWDINSAVAYRYTNPYGDTSQYLGQRLTGLDKASQTELFSYDFTRGSTGSLTSLGSGNRLRSNLDYDMGYSYVAMGEWSWRVVDLNGAAAGDSGDLLFVNGDRTPASAIPVSGSATYDARSLALLSTSFTAGIPFSLTANFGQGTISTRIDQDYHYNPAAPSDGDAALGIHVGGSAPFSVNGLFAIPLTGTANYSNDNPQITPPSEAVIGTMDGAFFGPHAEQVGGVLSVERSNGVLLMQDAFVGRQH